VDGGQFDPEIMEPFRGQWAAPFEPFGMSWAAVLLLAALARSHWHRIDTKEGSIAICVTIYLADLGQANHRAGRSLGLQHWSRAALAMYVCVCVSVCVFRPGGKWAPLGRHLGASGAAPGGRPFPIDSATIWAPEESCSPRVHRNRAICRPSESRQRVRAASESRAKSA